MRLGVWWLVTGTLVALGAYWFALVPVVALDLDRDWVPYAVHVLGGAGGGAMLAACAPVRPWRAPVACALACVGLMAILFVVAPHPGFQWVAARSAHPWWLVAMLAALTAISAAGGAALARMRPAELGTAQIVALSGLTIIGSWLVVVHTATGFIAGPQPTPGAGLVLLPSSVVAGLVVQAAVPRRCPRACAAGTSALLVYWIGRAAWTWLDLLRALGAVLLFAPFVYLGARLGWRWIGSRRPSAPVIPAARSR